MVERIMNRLLIATNNKGKVMEIRDLLKEIDIELITPADIQLALEVPENGKTYAENAVKKAVAFATASGLPALADDSGLEVEALDGAPGLYSARYGPPLSLPPFSRKMGGDGGGFSDADRRTFLLVNLENRPRPWKAHFHATIAIAGPTGDTEIAEGMCYGEIIPTERGSGGFGYDPIFLLPELGRTMAELDMEQKNRLSHRARAVISAMPILRKMFGML